jgi:formylglycine-generating enzyme required for sulfatase activity
LSSKAALPRIVRPLILMLVALPGVSCQRSDQPAPKIFTTKTGFPMVAIPAGRFMMGSEDGSVDESPAHEVWVDAFLMDQFEVTQARFAEISGGEPNLASDPSHFKGPDRPVEMVSWADAALFCNERSRVEGLEPCYDEETAECNFQANGYRLPTEAEWEYACRAGGNVSPRAGAEPRELDRLGWFKANASGQTHFVGRKKPNAWGLFDLHGNVAEWCNDIYDEGYYASSPRENPRGPADGEKYVIRGGSWAGSAATCGASRRASGEPGFQDACFARNHLGFRCVRRAPDAASDTTAAESPAP